MASNSATLFILGAGYSISSGFPKTGEITRAVLAPTHDETLTAFIESIVAEIEGFYDALRLPHTTDYEEIYYVSRQLVDAIAGEYENPALFGMAERLIKSGPRLPATADRTRRRFDSLEVLGRRASHHIFDVAMGMITEGANKEGTQPRFVVEACESRPPGGILLFTLNHDRLLETSLREAGIAYSDGFEECYDRVSLWKPDAFEDHDVRLFKLHGSIDWRRYQTVRMGSDRIVRVPLPFDELRRRHPGLDMHPADRRPVALMGTFNKLIDYTRSVFLRLQHELQVGLERARTVVICGYGFRDKGVNGRIAEWLLEETPRRMVVVHPDTDRLRQSARGAIANKWDHIMSLGRLVCLNQKAEDVSWKTIATTIEDG